MADESFAALFEQGGSSKALRRQYHPGESLEVTIVAVGRDAVFAELGGKQEGVFERPELSAPDGTLRVEVGSRVTAVVDGIEKETGQVRLRPVVIKAETGDVGVTSAAGSAKSPAQTFVAGARIKGQVTGIERYGVFVQIAGTHGRSGRGLVPGPETGTPRGADLKKHFTVGQELEAKILSIDETGKIRLSIAALSADAERGDFEAYAAGKTGDTAGAKPNAAKPEKVRGFGTLGDLLPKAIPATAPKPEPRAKTAAKPPAKASPEPSASSGPPSKGVRRLATQRAPSGKG
jgi:small subunit ribosomal protein S1